MSRLLSRRRVLQHAACACSLGLIGCAAQRTFVRADIHNGQAYIPLTQLSTEHSTLVYLEALSASIAIDHVATDTKPENAWRALLLVCTHRGCNVAPDRTGYTCPCHDSRFDEAGDVINGPANEALATLPCIPTHDTLVVTLPI